MSKLTDKLKNTLIEYHAQGVALTPLNDKAPFGKKWQHTKPENFNLSTFTNYSSAGMIIPEWMVVIDVDNHGDNEGTKSLEKMSKDFGFNFLMNAGIAIKTASKGYHLYYKIPVGVRKKIANDLKKYPSVEFKGSGRQVVIPNSQLSDGRSYSYDILHNKGWNQIIEVPKDFFDAITTKSNRKSLPEESVKIIHNHPADIASFKGYLADHKEVLKGDRNNTAFIFAAEGKERSLSKEIILEHIIQSEKLSPCLDEEELKQVIKSAFNKPEIVMGLRSVVENFGGDFFLDDQLIPEPVRVFINDGARRLQCPADYIFAGLIVTISSLIAINCRVQVAQNDHEQVITPNLWGMIVGGQGIRKSTGVKKSTNLLAPLEEEALHIFQQEMDLYDLEKEEASKNGKKDKIFRKKPVLKRFTINDSTVEKISEILAESPNCKLLFRDEIIGFLDGLEKDKNKTDKAFFLEAWNGNSPYLVDRIQRGSMRVSNLCLSIIGTIQPTTLSNYFSKFFTGIVNDGFIQRFQILVYPDTSNRKIKIIDEIPNQAGLERVNSIIRKLSANDFLEGVDPERKSSGAYNFKFTQEAQKIYNQWFEDLMNLEIPKEEDWYLKEHLLKYSSLIPSLALIFHLINTAEEKVENRISLEALEMAINYSKYLKAHAKRIYAHCNRSKKSDPNIILLLLNKIKDGQLGKIFSIRDISRKEWSGLKDQKAVTNAVNTLEEEDYIVLEETKKSVSYRVNFALKNSLTDGTDSTDS